MTCIGWAALKWNPDAVVHVAVENGKFFVATSKRIFGTMSGQRMGMLSLRSPLEADPALC